MSSAPSWGTFLCIRPTPLGIQPSTGLRKLDVKQTWQELVPALFQVWRSLLTSACQLGVIGLVGLGQSLSTFIQVHRELVCQLVDAAVWYARGTASHPAPFLYRRSVLGYPPISWPTDSVDLDLYIK